MEIIFSPRCPGDVWSEISDEELPAARAVMLGELFSLPLPTLPSENAPNGLQRARSGSDDADLEWLLGE